MEQSQKKNKGKLSAGAMNSVLTSPVCLSSANNVSSASVEKDNCNNLNEILPKKVGMKTVFKDVEVTMTQCDDSAVPASAKKKKKKKKSKQKAKEVVQEASSDENKIIGSLLKFNENYIELVNHPEISITVSNGDQDKEKELESVKSVKDNSTVEVAEQAQSGSTTTPSSSAVKKKRKKKKKKNSENVPTTISASDESTYTAPKYVKLPANDNSCVLVVSHDNFSNGNNNLKINNDASKISAPQNEISMIPLSNEKSANEVSSKNASSFNSGIQIGGSVSIFPVTSTSDSETLPEKWMDLNNGPNLEKISSIVKADTKENTSAKIVSNAMNENVPNAEEATLSKAQLKAERRAKQEAQRAAKLAKTIQEGQSVSHSGVKESSIPETTIQDFSLSKSNDQDSSLSKDISSKSIESGCDKIPSKLSVEKELFRKVRLFSHLPHCKLNLYCKQLGDMNSKIHPSILEIGSQYAKSIICGSNSRCLALLAAFRDVIKDYAVSADKNFSRGLELKLQTNLNFLNNCRPLSVSMINAVKFLKHQINHIPPEINGAAAKEKLCQFINDFVNEEILLAKEAIGNSASAKIVDGDVILVFAYSSLVKDVLCKAFRQCKVFQVIVVDSRPKLEGLEMLRCLVRQGLRCSYISVSSISYVMKEVSKVIIGAHALLSNGCVMSRLGCKQIALVASSYSVPVLVCCETYKFCERVLTDSFVHNELGEPDELVHSSLVQNNSLKNWQDLNSLQILNLLYDVTPPDLISMVITEKGVLPCTSVPVVLRVRHAGLHE